MGSTIIRLTHRIKQLVSFTVCAVLTLALSACAVPTSDSALPSPAPSAGGKETALPAAPAATAEYIDPVTPLSVLNQNYAAWGSMTIAGMSGSDYDAAISTSWTNIDTPGKPVSYDIDLRELMDYKTIEQYILNLGRYDGVDVISIGRSERGRNLYMVRLNVAGNAETDRPLIMLTGSVHAREFAGAEYTIKFLTDTLKKAQTDAYTRSLLEHVTIVVVPLVNPDGRELIIGGGDPSRKSNANGVDLNRAMPSVNAGQLATGASLPENFSFAPGMDFFAGYRLGTESETQAMIQWFNTYVPKAAAYIDLHQQGGISLYSKPFASKESEAVCRAFANRMDALLQSGYEPKKETEGYSLNGDGGTMTDYARSISEGFVYSYRLGRMALRMNSTEVPLICFGNIDNRPDCYQPLNAAFKCMTIEIGRKPSFLGAAEEARAKRAKEYEKYGWKNFLTGTIEVVLGNETVERIQSETRIK